jgi:tripartite-type tricarboxylate transporter receptor subunit TctC
LINRRLLVVGAGAAGLAPPLRAQESGFPTRPITVVIPSTSGGSAEFIVRIIGDWLRERGQQGFLADARPGAGGIVGTLHAATARPDGYTLVASPNSPLVFHQLTHKTMPYDPKALTPITMLTTQPLVMGVRGDFPGESMADLIEYARRNPGKVHYASQGIGGGNHLAALLLSKYTKTEMNHVPYPGAVPGVQAMLKSEVDFYMAPLASVLPWYKQKQLKMFGVGSPERHPDAPDVPTFRELGYPEEFILTVWTAIVGPPKMPEPIVNWIYSAVRRAYDDPVIFERVKALGSDPGGTTPAETRAFISRELATWERVARENNIEKQ